MLSNFLNNVIVLFIFQVIMGTKDGAEKACKEPNPVIDGRKANVNLAVLGAKPRVNSLQGSNSSMYYQLVEGERKFSVTNLF